MAQIIRDVFIINLREGMGYSTNVEVEAQDYVQVNNSRGYNIGLAKIKVENNIIRADIVLHEEFESDWQSMYPIPCFDVRGRNSTYGAINHIRIDYIQLDPNCWDPDIKLLNDYESENIPINPEDFGP